MSIFFSSPVGRTEGTSSNDGGELFSFILTGIGGYVKNGKW